MKEDLIRQAPLFTGLSEAEQKNIAEKFEEGSAPVGAALFQAGAPGEALYLIGQGFVRLTTSGGSSLATLGPGSVLGEDALFRSSVHELTAMVIADVDYWALSDEQLRAVILEYPAIGIRLGQNFGSQIAQMQDYLIRALSATPEFSGMPRHTLEAVAGQMRAQTTVQSDVLYHAGGTPQGLFLIEEGSVELQPDTANSNEERRTLGKSNLLGVNYLIANKPYTHSAVAAEGAFLWTLTGESFQELASRHPGLRRHLSRSVRMSLSRPDQAKAVMRLAEMPIFADVPPQALQATARKMTLQHAAAGERVYRIGEPGDAMYLIEQGEVELAAENAVGVLEELARIGQDGYFGEMSLLSSQLRTEDATATRHTNLLVISKADLDALAQQYPMIGKALSAGLAARLSRASASDVNLEHLRAFRLFSDLNDAELSQVAQRLAPNRFRAGEQIFRASAPAEELFLLENGQVRIQPFSGGSWMLGPGETFGERALLSNQPHNSTAIAESDVDVWTLSKEDFNQLLTAYPSLAINISRMLSQRMGEPAPMADGGAGMRAVAPNMAPVAYEEPRQRRGRQSGTPETRRGFFQWFGGLSTPVKIQFIILLLLLLYLVGIAAPTAINRMLMGAQRLMNAGRVASAPSSLSVLDNALDEVHRVGSFQVAAMNGDAAQAIALADQQVPATPTYTPFPTQTAIPTATPTITPTPTPAPTNTPVPVFVAAPVVQAAEAEPEVEAAAAPLPPIAWDGRLDRLGVTVEPANVQPGQTYWRLIEARWLNEEQSAGKHHIYVEALDLNGSRVVGQTVTVFWDGDSYSGAVENKAPPDFGFNFQMYASGYAYSVKVEGMPSDVLKGAGMGSITDRFRGIHTSFELVFQQTVQP